jgi:hypothetical protein
VSLQIPITTQLPRPKAYFYFYSPLQTVFSSPTVSDTTVVSTDSRTRVTLKTYSLTLPPGANRIRVLVYGYRDVFTGSVYLNIDGVDVASADVNVDSETLLIDYIGSITPGSHTVKVDAVNVTSNTVYITKVYIATGIGLTSTTPTTIATFTLTYQLLRQGDIRYSPGIRVFVWGNRKTTAPISLTIPEATDITVGRNNLGAGDDNDKAETILAILTGSITLQEGGEFTVSATLRGNVGASGDIVIITRILARAQLRREHYGVGEVRVYERGVAEYFARAIVVSVPGGTSYTYHQVSFKDVREAFTYWIGIGSSGSNIILHNYKIAVVTPVNFVTYFDDDTRGETFLEWASVVVWG